MNDWTSILGSGMLALSACGLTVALTYRLYLYVRLCIATRRAKQAVIELMREMAEVREQHGMEEVTSTMVREGFTHEVRKDGTATVQVFTYGRSVIEFYDS